MEITLAQVTEIANTLPIGFYATRRVPMTISDTEETSFYSPQTDEITISYPIIAQGLKSADETYSKEMAIRSMLYHELSHAILTPPNLMNDIGHTMPTEIMNIFEDERIETIFKNYYHNVDFKKQLYMITGGLKKPECAEEVFFNLVRFRVHDNASLVSEVEEIIKRYYKITGNADYYEYSYYISAVRDLWLKVKRDAEENGMPSYADSLDKLNEILKQMFTGDMGDNSEEGEESKSSSSTGKGEESKDGDSDDSLADSLSSLRDALSKDENIKPSMKRAIANMFDEKRCLNTEVYNTLEMIIGNFNKKNTGGSGITTYSGIFNPRLTTRNDYRYFERSSSVNGNNKFGTLHLNLFLDDSGSFRGNDAICNEIIKALTVIEKRNENFKFDVYFIAEGIQHAETPKERFIKSNKGNWLVHEIYDVFRKAQTPNTYNYNIVMFDGDAFSADVPFSCPKSDLTNFKAFDTNSTTLITDPYNRKYVEKAEMHSAKVIYTRDYVDELAKHVSNALSQAFR